MIYVPKTVTEIRMGHNTDTKRQDNNMVRAGVWRSFLVELISKLNLNMKKVYKTILGKEKKL